MFPLSPILLEKTVFVTILALSLCLFAIMSVVFSYHWKRFGIPTPLFRKMTRLYYLVSSALAIVSLLFFLSIIVAL